MAVWLINSDCCVEEHSANRVVYCSGIIRGSHYCWINWCMIPFSWRLNPSSQYLNTSSHHLNLPPKVKILILLRFKSFLPKFTSLQTMFVERFIKDDMLLLLKLIIWKKLTLNVFRQVLNSALNWSWCVFIAIKSAYQRSSPCWRRWRGDNKSWLYLS